MKMQFKKSFEQIKGPSNVKAKKNKKLILSFSKKLGLKMV